MNVEDNNGLDYILQAISNKTRRRILKLLAEEAPLTYTKMMQKLDIKDSGTLGFHLKKMAKLLRRDEFGEYRLSDLGWKALNIMKQLEGEEEIKVKEEEDREEEKKLRVFSDHLKFEYTPRLARRLQEENVKAVFTDIITLVIHPMSRELFNETVESISDVLTCYVPEDLYDDAVLKSSDVFRFNKYRRGDQDIKGKDKVVISKVGEEVPGGWIDTLISGLVTTLTSSISGIVTFFAGDRFAKRIREKKREVYLTEEIHEEFKSIRLELTGGYFDVKEGSPKIVAWTTDGGKPDVSYRVEGGTLNIYCSSGYIEIFLPDRLYKNVVIEISGGVLKTFKLKANNVSTELDGGMANIDVSISENGNIKLSMSGGVAKAHILASEGFKLVDFSIHGGYLDMKIVTPRKPIDIDVDREGGWVDIQIFGKKAGFKVFSGGEHKVRGEVSGGYGRIAISELEKSGL